VTPTQSQLGIQRHYPWQNECPCNRRLDNYQAVEWAVAAKELGFPKQTDGKRMVRGWWASRSASSLIAGSKAGSLHGSGFLVSRLVRVTT
jgi:hypothetical protein